MTKIRLKIDMNDANQAMEEIELARNNYLSDVPLFVHLASQAERSNLEAALAIALQGEDEEASRMAIGHQSGSRLRSQKPTQAFLAAARQAPGIDGDVAIAIGTHFSDFEVTATKDDEPVYSTWIGDTGRRHHRIALGSGVHVCEDGAILLPELPETVVSALPGMPLSVVLDHPAFDGGEIIREVVTRRMYGGKAYLKGVRTV